MLALVLSILVANVALQADTAVVVGIVERDLTGDGMPEVLQLLGTGKSLDSLDVTFSIQSSGQVIYRAQLWPITRTTGFGAARRQLSVPEPRTRLDEFAAWFFGDSKFLPAQDFVAEVTSWGTRFAPGIPEVIARDHRAQFVVDSLTAIGHPRAEAERRSRSLHTGSLDAAIGAKIWQSIQESNVTVFVYSLGGDRVQAIAWSNRDGRFYQLVECC
jgi:hypothetical protein